MTRLFTFLLLSLLMTESVYSMENSSSGPCKKQRHHRKKKKKQATQQSITRKSLSNDYGSRVALALWIVNKPKKCSGEDKNFIQNLRKKEQTTLLNAAWHPLQLANIVGALLPLELTNRIAFFIGSSLPALQYKKLKSSAYPSLKNASRLCFNPHKEEIAFIRNQQINVLQKDQTEPKVFNQDTVEGMTKITFSPTKADQLIAIKDNYLTIISQELMTGYGDEMIKDFSFRNENENLLVYPKDNYPKTFSTFSLLTTEFSFSDKGFIVSPETRHIALDPHHTNRAADTSAGFMRVFDVSEGTIQSLIPIVRNHGKIAFDPHFPHIAAYISGSRIRILDLKKQTECAQLPHKSPIVDFDFDPHKPYRLIVTQKNEETTEWMISPSKKNNPLSLDRVVSYLRKGNIS